jgi:HPt (histidine-containing phosphotransfer) domain-containing protein
MLKTKSDHSGVDRAVLQQLRLLNSPEEPDFFQCMVQLLIDELNQWQPILSHAAEHQDWAQLVKAAHEIGGTGMQCGAGKLAELCRKLQLMDPSDFIQARMLLPELLAEIELVRRILTSEVTHK